MVSFFKCFERILVIEVVRQFHHAGVFIIGTVGIKQHYNNTFATIFSVSRIKLSTIIIRN